MPPPTFPFKVVLPLLLLPSSTHLTYPIPTIPTIAYTYPLYAVATATRLSSPSSLFYLIRPKPRSTFPTAPSFQKARPAPEHTEHSYFLCSAAWPVWAYYNTSAPGTSNTKPNLLVSLALEISQQRLSQPACTRTHLRISTPPSLFFFSLLLFAFFAFFRVRPFLTGCFPSYNTAAQRFRVRCSHPARRCTLQLHHLGILSPPFLSSPLPPSPPFLSSPPFLPLPPLFLPLICFSSCPLGGGRGGREGYMGVTEQK